MDVGAGKNKGSKVCASASKLSRRKVIPATTACAHSCTSSGGQEPTQFQYIAYTTLFNISGHCAASVPAGSYMGMPVGLQIVGRPGDEALVLRAARALERARLWARHRPQL